MMGAYFPVEDYASFWRRLAIDAVDGIVALVVYIVLAFVLSLVGPANERVQPEALLALGGFVWLAYFVLLKWSRLRTVGYRLGSVRLVDLQGEPAGLFAIVLRSSFMILGPLNYILDLAWLSGDAHRQALRDKFAHTYVIKASAVPLGMAPLQHATYHLAGTTLHFPEVRVPPANPGLTRACSGPASPAAEAQDVGQAGSQMALVVATGSRVPPLSLSYRLWLLVAAHFAALLVVIDVAQPSNPIRTWYFVTIVAPRVEAAYGFTAEVQGNYSSLRVVAVTPDGAFDRAGVLPGWLVCARCSRCTGNLAQSFYGYLAQTKEPARLRFYSEEGMHQVEVGLPNPSLQRTGFARR